MEEDFLEIATGFEASHRKVVQQPVSTILRCGSGYFALEFCYETEGLLHEFEDVGWFQMPSHQQIIAREAPHRPPIDDAVLPIGMVAKIGGCKVFDGMQGSGMEGWLAIRLFHADVESGNLLCSNHIATADVNAAKQPVVVDCEAGNLIHD